MNATITRDQVRIAWRAVGKPIGKIVERLAHGDTLDHRTTGAQGADQQAEISVGEAYAVLHGPMVP